jgi:hypothetical protein
MNRRLLAWLLAAPLTVGASLAGHELAYRIVEPDAQARAHALDETGHAYFQHLPLVVALASVMLLFAFGAHVNAAIGRASSRLTLKPFAALPPLVFILQEHFERLWHDAAFPAGAVAEPTFLVGLILQVPFALLAYGLARLLIRAADELGAALGAARLSPLEAVAVLVPTGARAPRLHPLSAGYPVRGPPAAS